VQAGKLKLIKIKYFSLSFQLWKFLRYPY